MREASADEPIPRLKVNPVQSRLEPRVLKRPWQAV